MDISDALAAFTHAGGKGRLALVPDDERAAAIVLLEAASMSSDSAVAALAQRALDALTELRHWTEHYAGRFQSAHRDWLVVTLRAADRYEYLTAVVRTALREIVVALEDSDEDPRSVSA